MDWKLLLQIVGVALGLLYLRLEYRADIRLWIVGLAMPVVHGVLYYRAGLYADCSMQAYYVWRGFTAGSCGVVLPGSSGRRPPSPIRRGNGFRRSS